MRLPGPRRGRDEGSVTAETAMVLPVLLSVTIGLVWLLSLGLAQLRVIEAARETARALARDEAAAASIALGRRIAPAGATIEVEQDDALVTVEVVTRVRGPAGLFGFLPPVEVDAEAVAAQEQR